MPACAFLYTLIGMTGDDYTVPRRSERKPVRKAIVLVVESEDPEVRHEGTTVDISAHGAKVEASAPLAPGQTLSLIQPDDPSRALRCLVVWAGDVGSDSDGQVGLEFLEPPISGFEN